MICSSPDAISSRLTAGDIGGDDELDVDVEAEAEQVQAESEGDDFMLESRSRLELSDPSLVLKSCDFGREEDSQSR